MLPGMPIIEASNVASKNNGDNTNKQVGHYLTQRSLGEGEFGHVYLARDVRHKGPLVAIKLFKAFLSQLEKESFFEEAKILKKLNHEYILGFYEANVHNDTPYLVVEYAPNGSLRKRITQYKPTLLSLQTAITILEQIGAALYYAHQQQVIHRDLKPENILFNARDDALLADFGIASKQDTDQNIAKFIAKRPYMSPEELQFKTFIESDQYALGIIAYELFTGHVPFTEYEAIPREEPRPLREYNPQLPDYIESAVLKAIEKQIRNRHDNVSVFIARLKGVQEQTELFDVFLSYSEDDEEWAEDLAKRLKDEKSINVWFRKWKMIPGRPEQKTIEEALERSKCYAICIGAEEASKWVDMELQAALRRQKNEDSFGVIAIYLPEAKELDATEFLGSNTPVDYRNLHPDYAFYLLTCGIKGIEPGVWKPETPSIEDKKRSATEIELQELQRLINMKLIEPDEASERRRQILQRPLASDSIKSRLKEIKQLHEEKLITDEIAEEKIRKITDEI
jgi:thiamine kinase-like enzyme